MNVRCRIYVCGALLVAICLSVTASADTRLWNTTSGSFTDPVSWLDGVPGAGDVAWFNHDFGGGTPPYTVTFRGLPVLQGTANYVNAQLQIGPNVVNFVRSNDPVHGPATYALTSAMVIGETGDSGVLNTTLLSLSGPLVRIGAFSNGQGELNVNAGTFNVTGSSQPDYELRVGEFAIGTMNISGGAQIILPAAEGNAVLGQNIGATGTVNVVGPGSVWNNASDSATAPLVVGDLGTGTINISGGGQVNNFIGKIAIRDGSVGSVHVFGQGSTWTNRGDLNVSIQGAGLLSISDGGQVTSANAALGGGGNGIGMVRVADVGSTWKQLLDLQVGAYLGTILGGGDVLAVGTLDISSGGRTQTLGDASITAPGSRATVDGDGSIWTVGGDLEIDRAAILNIAGGGLVRSNTALVSSSRDGSANVTGTGSAWDIADLLSLGQGGNATLNVTAGGRVSNRLAFVGLGGFPSLASSGLLVVDGARSTFSSSEQLFVGYRSSGQLVVTNGGQVFTGTGQIGLDAASVGYVGISGAGSKWTNSESLNVGVAGTGQLVVSSGGTVVVDDRLSVGLRGRVEGNSHIAAEVRSGGTVAPGLSASFVPTDALGTLHIDGDYTQTSSGTLDIQLASLTNFDKLAIDGHATLGGKLRGSLFDGFSPDVGATFQVLTATDGITGTFELDFTTLSPSMGTRWTLVYSDSDVILRLIDALPGDYNADGLVTAADYVVWRNNMGSGTSLPNDDTPGVGTDDYERWVTHFGQSLGSGSSIPHSEFRTPHSSVPEPASLLLCGLAVVVSSARHCRRSPSIRR